MLGKVGCLWQLWHLHSLGQALIAHETILTVCEQEDKCATLDIIQIYPDRTCRQIR